MQPAGAGAVGEILAVTPWAETEAARAEATRTTLESILDLCVRLIVVEMLVVVMMLGYLQGKMCK